MAEGTIEVAKAYVTIVPSLKGSKQTISQELGTAGAQAGDEAGSTTGNAFLSACGSVLAAGAKVIATATLTATTALAAGVVAIGKAALTSYADYEQLAGGVETLFGTGGKTLEEYAASVGATVDEIRDEYNSLSAAEEQVMENASNAFKTAGLSANEYMETVTSFSASLLQSLDGDTQAAAAAADMAIQDMADNANKMGTDMSSIQSAYQGFAKQNYTMLDNLKLGYGGTQAEMERLLADATAISGIEYDISNLNDIYSAIHVIQTEMGITGTTAEEAMFTISGSASATEAAWNNVLTAIAGGGDLDKAVDDLVESIFGGSSGGGLLNNILPRVDTIINGIGDFLVKAAPILADKVPTILETVATMITTSLPVLFTSFNTAFNTILQTLITLLPTLLPVVVEGVMLIASTILSNLPLLISTMMDLITQLVVYLSEADVAAQLTQGALNILLALANGIIDNLPVLLPAVINLITEIVTTLTEADNISAIVEAALAIVGAIVFALVNSLPEIGGLFYELLLNIADLFLAAVDWVADCCETLVNWWNTTVKPWFTALFTRIGQWFSNVWTTITTWFSNLISKVAEWFLNIYNKGVTIFNNIKSSIVNFFANAINSVVNGINNIKTRVTTFFATLKSNAATLVSDIWNTIRDWFTSLPGKLESAVQSAFDTVKNWATNFTSYGEDLVSGLWNGISNKVTWLYNKIKSWVSSTLTYIKNLFGISSPSKVMRDQVGKFMAEGIGVGFTDEMKSVEEEMAESIPTSFNTSVGISGQSGASYSPDNTSVANYGRYTFNIYGAEGQDVNELADAVIDRLQHITEQEEDVYA